MFALLVWFTGNILREKGACQLYYAERIETFCDKCRKAAGNRAFALSPEVLALPIQTGLAGKGKRIGEQSA